MDVTREDVDLMVRYLDLKEDFLAAKEVRDEEPERFAAAKQAFSAERTYWRCIREAIGADLTADGDATVTVAGITDASQITNLRYGKDLGQ